MFTDDLASAISLNSIDARSAASPGSFERTFRLRIVPGQRNAICPTADYCNAPQNSPPRTPILRHALIPFLSRLLALRAGQLFSDGWSLAQRARSNRLTSGVRLRAYELSNNCSTSFVRPAVSRFSALALLPKGSKYTRRPRRKSRLSTRICVTPNSSQSRRRGPGSAEKYASANAFTLFRSVRA